MRLPFRGPQGQEVADGTTSWPPAPAADDRAAAGAESRAVLELRWSALGGLSQPAPADAAGRGRPMHAGDPAVPNPVLRALPAGVSTRRGRRAGAAARRVRARRDRPGRATP